MRRGCLTSGKVSFVGRSCVYPKCRNLNTKSQPASCAVCILISQLINYSVLDASISYRVDPKTWREGRSGRQLRKQINYLLFWLVIMNDNQHNVVWAWISRREYVKFPFAQARSVGQIYECQYNTMRIVMRQGSGSGIRWQEALSIFSSEGDFSDLTFSRYLYSCLSCRLKIN